MKVSLEANIELNKALPKGADVELKKFFDDANKRILRIKDKIIGTIDEQALKNEIITLKISSKGDGRAYDTIVRFRKQLSELLGKKFKVGIKSIVIKDTTMEIDLEKEPMEKMTMPFVKSIETKGTKATLVLEDLDELALERSYPAKIIKRIAMKINAQYVTGKAATERVVRISAKKINRYAIQKDPTDEIIAKGWVKEFPGAGVWIIMPPFAALMRAIYNVVIEKIAKQMDFTEIMLPRLIPLEVAKKKGTLGGIPYEMLWVCPPSKRDPKFFEDYNDYVNITGESAPEKLAKKLDPPMFGLSHGQCEPFYELLGGEIIDAENLPIKMYDINGPTWRWEGGGLKGLERLNEFQRIEFVYAGTKEQVIKIRDEILKKSEEIVNKIFDIQYRVDANIPVYLEHAGAVTEEKEADFVKSYDLVAVLPFQTISKPESELEISSYHVHTDYYMKRFHVKEKTDKDIWTGCSGIGPSRWAFTFLTRWGFDYKKWPKEIRKYIGTKLPDIPRMVTWPNKIKK